MITEKTDCDKHKWIPLLGINKGRNVPTALFTCLKCGDLKVGTETIKISRFRLDMGDLPIKSVSTIGIKEPLASDHTASGIIVSMTAGENLVFGDFVYFKSDGKCWKADANVAGAYPCMGMAIATINVNTAGDILLHGTARDDTWNWITVGGVVYLSIVAGEATQTQPSTTNDAVQVLGIATNADRIYFNPSKDYITRA
ncbi:MAG: hypothetical protein WC587_02175 [Candidatus Paceibacterota bacterium]